MTVIARITISLFLILTATANFAVAATRYVEKWGTDAVGPCVKSNPCFEIGTAIDVSGKNDRIVVGPGTYTETGLSIQPPREGLRLESTAGRHATTIVSGDGGSVLAIEAIRVRVGKKGKGFTLIGATNFPSNAGININVPEEFAGIRIEGNRIGRPRSSDSTDFDNSIGIRVSSGGGKLQVRNNIIENNERNGIDCARCPRALIRDNRIESNGSSGLRAYIDSPQLSFQGNLVTSNADSGISHDGTSEQMTIRNNIIELNQGYGVSVLDGDGGRVEANIVTTNTDFGMTVSQEEFTRGGIRINKNLVMENTGFVGDGIVLSLAVDALVDSNTLISNGADGLYLDGVTLRSLKNNAAIGNGECGIDANFGTFDNFRFFALGNSTAPTCGGAALNPTGPIASRPVPLKVNRTARVVGG